MSDGVQGGLGLFSESFARAPEGVLARLAGEEQAFFDGESGFWVLSRYADVRNALMDPERFRPDNVLDALVPFSWRAMRVLGAAGFNLPPTLANNGTETHAGLRSLVNGFFNGAALRDGQEVVDRASRRALEAFSRRLEEDGEADIATVVGRRVPAEVLMEVLGLEGASHEELERWTHASLQLFWGRPSAEEQEGLAGHASDFYRWLLAQVVRVPTAPAGSFLAALGAHRKPDGKPLRRSEMAAVCYFMAIAGQVSTGYLVSTALLRLAEEPGAWEEAASHPGRLAPWCEEVLRRDSPLSTWRRVTAAPVEIGAVRIPAGSQVLLALAGSGWDEEVFPDPQRLDPARERCGRHLAFGAGRHRCVGAAFARMELQRILAAVLERFPSLALSRSDPPPYLALLSFRAPLEVWLRRPSPSRLS